MPRVVLITGVSQLLAGRLAGRLAADRSVTRVIGVDDVAPATADLDQLGRTEFVRLGVGDRSLGALMEEAQVDTVVHLSAEIEPYGARGRPATAEARVLATMRLAAACQHAPTVTNFVLNSTAAVYARPGPDAAVHTEVMTPVQAPRRGHVRDALDIERYVGQLERVRPDLNVTVLRSAPVIGPFVDSVLTRYFRLPLLPTTVGWDPRLQFVHEVDALEVLRLAALSRRPGTFNLAGDGVLSLSQAVRRAGRISAPVPGPLLGLVARGLRRRGEPDPIAPLAQLLRTNVVMSTNRLKYDFGYTPRHDTAGAFAAYLAGRPVHPVIEPGTIVRAEQRLATLLGVDNG